MAGLCGGVSSWVVVVELVIDVDLISGLWSFLATLGSRKMLGL